MRAYGVMMDDAGLKQAAFALGLTDSATANITAQQKILAEQKVMFDQTQTQQGDFARTADGLANSQRTMGSAWEDFKTSLGTVFLPVVEQVMGVVKEFAERWLPVLQSVIKDKVVPAVKSFAEGLGAFMSGAGSKVIEWVGAVIDWFKQFWEATADTREKGLASIGGLLEGIWNFAVSVGALIGQIIKSLGDLMAWFVFNDAGELRGWAKVVYDIFFGIIDTVTLVIDTISRLAEAMTAVLRGDWSGALYALTRYNGSTAGMVPLLDANGNRIGWQSAEQAGLNAGTVQQNSASSIVNTVNVNITTAAADPAQVGRDLSRAVQDALRAGGYS
jgi:phage-related protein